ncbi:MAG: response regulator [Candidatus Gastranaerophilales bacterium]|nr:response regulator [Candidatus Gastranaerophilales bacterium]MCM1072440.1 response regulator [Bacteroides sp.]
MLSTVLIIDKRTELPAKYKKCIDNAETNAVIARNLKDAISLVQSLEPDMIIVSDSIDEPLAGFCQKIRALTYNTRPVIVALSKSADFEDRISVLENGADDFLSEPVNIEEFKTRIRAHLRRDVESNLDNKTLLPNSKYVRKALKRVLAADNQAVLLVGVENLNNYKDVYTELAADKIIQTFVAIAKSALDENDFIGQLDEQNFVIVTNRFSAEKLAAFLTFAFDTVSPKFYSEEDAHKGYMLLKGERYAGMRANFVSILIGGILEGFNLIPSVEVLLSRLHAVKKLAKIPSGSNYSIERAKLTGSDSVVAEVINKNIYIHEPDESLGYLIRTALELQGYDVQEELVPDSVFQPAVIVLDSGESFENLDFLRKLKGLQNFVNTKFIVTTTVHNKSAILDSGADLYLPKPYEISDLIRWVEYFKGM